MALSKMCLKRKIRFTPFVHLNTNEIDNLNSVDSMKLLELIPNDDILSCANNINEFNINDNDDIDENVVDNINCRYYSCDEFFNLNNQKSFNILHSNVNGFVTHADNVHEFLSQSSKTKFDVICISETSLGMDDSIPDDAKPAGYLEPFTTETISNKGGVAIFAKKLM